MWNTKVGKRIPEHISKAVANVLESNERVEHEVTLRSRTLCLFLVPIAMERYVNVYASDITQSKKAEEALRESEQRWATTLASIGDAVIATDTSGKIMFMNGEAEKLTGWKLREATQKPIKAVFNIVNEQTRFAVENPINKVLQKGIVVGLANHTVLIRKDCSEVPIDDSGAPIKDKDGKTNGVVLIFRDITERKKAEDALRKSEKEYSSLFANMIDGFAFCKMIFDGTGKPVDFVYLQINDAFERITGLKKGTIVGKNVTEAIPGIKEANPELFEIYGRVASTCQKEKFEVFFKPLSMWLSISVYCPSIGYFAAIFEDITERKKAEDDLKNSLSREHFLAQLVRDASVAVGVGYPDGRLGMVNSAFTELTGYSEQELQKITWNTVLTPPEYVEFEKEKLAELNLTKRPVRYEKEYIRKDGSRVPIELMVQPFLDKEGNVTSYFSFISDITERKKAEEALKQSEQRYSALFNSIPEGFSLVEIVHDKNNKAVDFRFLEINAAYAKLLNKSIEQIVGKTTREAFGPIEDYWYKLYDKVAKTGEFVHYENYVQLLDEYYEVYAWRADVTNHVAILSTNITERKKTEKAIARQAELIDLSPDAIIVRKLDGTISFWSKGAEKLYGWTKEKAIGQNINSLLKTEFPVPPKEIQKRLVQDGKWSGEVAHTCASGNRIVVQSYWLGKFDADGKIFELLESNVDITPRILMQTKVEESAVLLEEYANQMETLATKRAEQLKDAERLAAIGATAGMVGHDIRNPLQAITGDVYLAKLELSSTTDSEEKKNALESLAEIQKNIDYINKIVADLQDFARPLKPILEKTDLKPIIDDLLKKNGLPKNVKVTVKVEAALEKLLLTHRI